MQKHLSHDLKRKMDKSKDFSRVLVAKHYDSLTFNYQGIGRLQVRFIHEKYEVKAEIYLNQTHWATRNLYDKETMTLAMLKDVLDMHIENDSRLNKMRQKPSR